MRAPVNYKGQLNEVIHRDLPKGTQAVYEVAQSANQSTKQQTFQMKVSITGKGVYIGTSAMKKKDAEQLAARAALEACWPDHLEALKNGTPGVLPSVHQKKVEEYMKESKLTSVFVLVDADNLPNALLHIPHHPRVYVRAFHTPTFDRAGFQKYFDVLPEQWTWHTTTVSAKDSADVQLAMHAGILMERYSSKSTAARVAFMVISKDGCMQAIRDEIRNAQGYPCKLVRTMPEVKDPTLFDFGDEMGQAKRKRPVGDQGTAPGTSDIDNGAGSHGGDSKVKKDMEPAKKKRKKGKQ